MQQRECNVLKPRPDRNTGYRPRPGSLHSLSKTQPSSVREDLNAICTKLRTSPLEKSESVIDGMSVLSPKAYTEALTPNVIILKVGPLGGEEV